jgi:hypothetical protein
MRKFCLIALLAAGAAMPVQPASAETLREAFDGFGLTGEWAGDCRVPASHDNQHFTWTVLSDSKGQMATDYGTSRLSYYDVPFAQRIGDDQIQLKLLNRASNAGLDMVVQKQEGRIHTVSSVLANGTALIKDGRYVSDGKETLRQEHCK